MFIISSLVITLFVQPTLNITISIEYGSRRILFRSLEKASSIQHISSKLFQPLCVKSGSSSNGTCHEFHIFAITFALFECASNVDLQGDISTTFLWLTCLRSKVSLRTSFTLFFLLSYSRKTYCSGASANSSSNSQDKPSYAKY